MNLSNNFTLKELTYSDKAIELKLDNTPSALQLENLKRLAAVLQVIRDALGASITVTSGFRSERVNVAVGGSKTSAHKHGLAADIKVKGMSAAELAKFINGLGLDLDQLILEYPDQPKQWVHIGLRDGKQRNEVLTKFKGQPYLKGLRA